MARHPTGRFACPIAYQYSGSFYLKTQRATRWQRNASAKDLLAFAPVFADTEEEPFFDGASTEASRDGGRAQGTASFAPLPHTAYEVNSIAQGFGPQQSRVLMGKAATEAHLKEHLQQPHRIVHVASHSFANLEQPEMAGIACAVPERQDAEDGVLYLREIYDLSIPADLVVLSSCESGLGQLAESEGLLGLHRAFAYAGVPNIVYSLWKVCDRSVRELMVTFYRHLREGKPYSTALRAAKLSLLHNPATASPSFWGGILLLGR